MLTDKNHNRLYKPSRLVITLKKIAKFAEHVLPDSAYRFVYKWGFASYRKVLHLFQGVEIFRNWLAGDAQGLKKATLVYKVMPYSLVGVNGLRTTYDCVYSVEENKIPGSIVECGVAQGGSAALMALVAARHGNKREIWLFDSFEGLPQPTDEDFIDGKTGEHVRELPPGSCLGLQEQVEALLFNKLDLDEQKIKLVKGWFEETILPYVEKIGPVAVLRVDADWYESVKHCLIALYDSVVPHGFVVIDDYGSCFGARKAVDEFLAERNIDIELIHDGRGGCHFAKPEVSS